MCGLCCCTISLIKAIWLGLLFEKVKGKYSRLSEPPPFLFPIFIINKKREKMLSGLEDFLHIWKRFSILQLPALAVHKPPLFTSPPAFPVCSLYFPDLHIQKECMCCCFCRIIFFFLSNRNCFWELNHRHVNHLANSFDIFISVQTPCSSVLFFWYWFGCWRSGVCRDCTCSSSWVNSRWDQRSTVWLAVHVDWQKFCFHVHFFFPWSFLPCSS